MLQLTWLVLLGVVAVGYVAGIHEPGVQMAALILDHQLPRGRKDTVSALGPSLLVHEAWLIGVAVLLAAIPWISPSTLSGLLTVIAVWLAGVLVGTIAARLRNRASPGLGRRTVTGISASGAAVAAAATGWNAGVLLGALPLGDDEVVALNPAMALLALVCATCCVALAFTHGMTYLAWKHVGVVATRAQTAAPVLTIITLVTVLAAALAVALGLTPPLRHWRVALICVVLILACLLCAWLMMKARRPGRAVAATSFAAAAPIALSCGLSPHILALGPGQHYPGKTTLDPDALAGLLILCIVIGPLVVAWGRWALRTRAR